MKADKVCNCNIYRLHFNITLDKKTFKLEYGFKIVPLLH